MSVAHSQVRGWAENYLGVLNRRDPDEIAERFALDATVEDPVGPPLYEGRDAIRGMFEQAATALSFMEVRRTTPISIAESYAAFAAVPTTEMDGARTEVDVVSVIRFGDDGLIVSLRVFYNFDEVRSVRPDE